MINNHLVSFCLKFGLILARDLNFGKVLVLRVHLHFATLFEVSIRWNLDQSWQSVGDLNFGIWRPKLLKQAYTARSPYNAWSAISLGILISREVLSRVIVLSRVGSLTRVEVQ